MSLKLDIFFMQRYIPVGKHNGLFIDELGAPGSVVVCLATAAGLAQKNHICNSVRLTTIGFLTGFIE